MDVVAQREERFRSPREVFDYLDRSEAAGVANCIGYTGAEAALHYMVNGCLPRAVADWAVRGRVPCVLVSTNAVFPADPERRWLPADPVSPRTVYETTKAFGEDPRVCVLRASFVGRHAAGRGLLERILAGQPYRDRRWNGVTALVLARHAAGILTRVGDGRSGGIEHLHSVGTVCLSDLAKYVGRHQPAAERLSDERLLGGGEAATSLWTQMDEYRSWLSEAQLPGVRAW
jgi:dTDP-4-dehydrorhamnose reductase